MSRTITSISSTSRIDVKDVKDVIDRYGMIEIWWDEPKEYPAGEPWDNNSFIVLYYDGESDRIIGALLEFDYKHLEKYHWTQIQTLEELPLRFNYKDHKNLSLPELIRAVVSELTTPTP